MRTQFLKISYLIFLVIFILLAFMISFLIFFNIKKLFLEVMIHQTNEIILLNNLIDPFFYSVRLLSYIFYLDLYLMSNE